MSELHATILTERAIRRQRHLCFTPPRCVKADCRGMDGRWFAASRVGRYAETRLPPDAVTLQQWRSPLDFDPRPYWDAGNVSCVGDIRRGR